MEPLPSFLLTGLIWLVIYAVGHMLLHRAHCDKVYRRIIAGLLIGMTLGYLTENVIVQFLVANITSGTAVTAGIIPIVFALIGSYIAIATMKGRKSCGMR